MAGWIAEMLFMLFLLTLLCNGQNITKHKAYWLIGVPIINPGACQPFKGYSYMLKLTNYYVFKKVNKQVAIRKNL